MIKEQAIDVVLERIEQEDHFVETRLRYYKENNGHFFAHLEDESFILSQAEKDYLLGVLLVILEASKLEIKYIKGEKWSKYEDLNWDQLAAHKNIEAYLDTVFKDYPQEDLLAYVEDSIAEMEDDFLSKVGREFILIKAKTVIDFIR